MPNTGLIWAIFAPLIGSLASLLFSLLRREGRVQRRVPARWLTLFDAAALLSVCAGLLAEGPLLYWSAGGRATLLGLSLAVPPRALYPLLASNAALLCAVFMAWGEQADTGTEAAPRLPWAVVAPGIISALLALGLQAEAPTVQVLCLLCVALTATAVAFLGVPLAYTEDDSRRTIWAQAVASGLKHAALATLGTGLLLVGVLLLERYSLNMENGSLLQASMALPAAGLLVRLGAMPFSAAYVDMPVALPTVSIMAMGAEASSVLALGLLLFAPVQGSLMSATLLPWLGPLAALLAGFRALHAPHLYDPQSTRDSSERSYSTLVAMSVAASLAWAVAGVLSGSAGGAHGAALLATNLALAVPLLVVSRRVSRLHPRLSAAGTAVGALSLLGLPPFGGAPGALLIAQTAVGINGVFVGALLLGSLLVAAGWLTWAAHHAHQDNMPASPEAPASPLPLLVCALIAAQVGLFFLR